ncbi:hypothetical protein [Enterococcus asini]|uniref:hypothetical protein n=1 Tax=Enterococcus asini TaxID=57732 RepID=UPI0026DC3EFF|nr:hypothetical protein [Enterococcus asini]
MIKKAIAAFPGWTINDVLDTDTLYLQKILFNTEKRQPKQEKAVPLADFIRQI